MKTKMIFSLYREERVVKMPLVEKIVVVDEEKVGEVRVIEARHKECLASLVGDAIAPAMCSVGMLAVESVFGTLGEWVESAVRGEVWRDARLWRDDTWGGRA